MLYDTDRLPADRLALTLMPSAADEDFAKEQGHIGVIAMKKNFAVEYETLDHTSTLRNDAVERGCRSAPFPSLFAVNSAGEELKRMEVVRRTGQEAVARREPPKGSTAELMRREARTDVVFEGPEYLYREPRCTVTSAKLLGSSLVDVGEIPTRSAPVSFAKRLVANFSEALSKERAARDCVAAMLSIVKLWEEKGAGRAGGRPPEGKFLDVEFFLGHRKNLYPAGTPHDSSVPEPRNLASLCAMYPTVDIVSPAVGESHQFMVPVCRSTHLVAAAEAMLWHPKGRTLLRELFVHPPVVMANSGAVPMDLNTFVRNYGFVGVLLFVNGEWEWVIVDDLVGTDAHGASPCMLRLMSREHVEELQGIFGPMGRSHHQQAGDGRSRAPRQRGHGGSPQHDVGIDGRDDPEELWPHLLQKAWAKWFGCYDAIDGGLPRLALEMLVGGTTRACTPLCEDTITAFDAFDDDSANALCLVYCGREQRLRRRPTVDTSTGTTLVQCCRNVPVWLPTRLPLVLRQCYISAEDAVPMVQLYSPWGALSDDGSPLVTLQWSEFIGLCDYYELCSVPTDGTVYVEGFGTSSRTSSNAFSFVLKAPLRASVTLTLRQSDPRHHLDLPLHVRRHLPCVGMGMTVTDVVNRTVVYETREPVVATEFSVKLRLLPAEYCVRLGFDEVPSVPFALRAAVSTLVTLKLWPTGLHSDVHGATTARLAAKPSEEVSTFISASFGARQDNGQPAQPPRDEGHGDGTGGHLGEGVAEAFAAVDVAERGKLDRRGVERALAEYWLSTTEQGRRLRQLLDARFDAGGTMAPEEFAEVIRKGFT